MNSLARFIAPFVHAIAGLAFCRLRRQIKNTMLPTVSKTTYHGLRTGIAARVGETSSHLSRQQDVIHTYSKHVVDIFRSCCVRSYLMVSLICSLSMYERGGRRDVLSSHFHISILLKFSYYNGPDVF